MSEFFILSPERDFAQYTRGFAIRRVLCCVTAETCLEGCFRAVPGDTALYRVKDVTRIYAVFVGLDSVKYFL